MGTIDGADHEVPDHLGHAQDLGADGERARHCTAVGADLTIDLTLPVSCKAIVN